MKLNSDNNYAIIFDEINLNKIYEFEISYFILKNDLTIYNIR